MNVGRIRGFLLQSPKPAKVRVSREDGGEPQTLTPRSYAKCAETIAALMPDLIECLDSKDTLLRALRPDGVEANPSDDVGLPKSLEAEPLAAAFMMYGRMLAKAYEHSTEVAFSKMVELADRMNERSDSIERRLERSESQYRKVQEERIDDAYERVDEAAEKAAEGNPLQTTIAQAFMGGLMQQQAPPAKPEPRPPARARTNGHSNGKGQA